MKKQNKTSFGKIFVWFLVGYIVLKVLAGLFNIDTDYIIDNPNGYKYDDSTFSIISSSENKILDESLQAFAKKNNIDIKITYTDTLDVIDKLNSGTK